MDAFVQSRLRQEGLAPAPEADRRTLIRRASLDITGLPPTPAEVRAFLADSSPKAYELLVDRLLASPRYAEKQAMHWLDAVRYADTCGFHGDNPLPAWPYRDYVLRAFRDNKPFDQFTCEQLAGDLLPGATVEQRVASAYNRLNRTSAEGGIQPKEYLAKYGADRVRTTSAVWMGSTMGCAECHDHKFDPFTARDFYSMKAFFADIKETGLVEDRGPKAWGTQLALPSPRQQKDLDAATAALEAARKRLEAAAAKLAGRRAAWEKNLLERYEAGGLAWKVQHPLAARSLNGAVLRVYNDELVDTAEDLRGSMVSGRKKGNGLVAVSGPNPDRDVYTVRLRPGAGEWTALGIEFVQDESLPGVRLARGSDRLVLSEAEAWVPSRGPSGKLAFTLATANTNFPRAGLPAMAATDGNPQTGWGIADYGDARAPFLALRFSNKVRTGANTVLEVKLRHESAFRRATAGRFRIALSPAEYSWPGIPDENSKSPGGLSDAMVKALRTPAAERTAEQSKAIAEHFHWAEPTLAALTSEAARLAMRRDLIDAEIPRVVVAQATEPEETRVLPRGNFLDDSGEVVSPATPGFLGKLDSSGRATRLDLANWLISPSNPLTARAFVNRLEINCSVIVDMDGSGTSSATPQIAAAAALWLQKHKASMTAWQGWQRVEAVRNALFTSASTDSPDSARYFGKGILRADRALAVTLSQWLEGQPADSASFGFWKEILGHGIAQPDPSSSTP